MYKIREEYSLIFASNNPLYYFPILIFNQIPTPQQLLDVVRQIDNSSTYIIEKGLCKEFQICSEYDSDYMDTPLSESFSCVINRESDYINPALSIKIILIQKIYYDNKLRSGE